jgi:predicted PurR-regulated permease PerM
MDAFPSRRSDPDLGAFAKRVLLVFLFAAIALALRQLAELAIVLFGAILLAIGLRTATRLVVRTTKLADAFGLVIVVLLIFVAFSAAFWFFGSIIDTQIDELTRQVPQGLQLFFDRVQSHPYTRYVLEQARGLDVAGATGWVATTLANFARTLVQGLGYAVVSLFVAIYLAAQPQQYRRLVLRLIPLGYASRAEKLFDKTGDVLRRWLIGQLVVMAVIGTLSGIALWALGIDAPFALGLVGGLLCFIPYVGAVVAAVPATLVALTQGPGYALAVILMYIGVHFVEGNFITPMVQAEATQLPPVFSLLSIIAFGILLGPSSVLVAAPLTLFLMVAVDVLYVEPGFGRIDAPSGAASGEVGEDLKKSVE